MSEPEPPTDPPAVGAGYAAWQLAKALTALRDGGDAEAIADAQARVDRWTRTLQGIFGGSTTVGSRTPLDNTPPWVTLEVATGGFATGGLLAAGPLRDHERSQLASLGIADERDARRALNRWHLTDDGLDRLREMLAQGTYRVRVPEEGALLTVAWLVDRGHVDEARHLIDQISTHLDLLRFYPAPVARPMAADARASLCSVSDVRAALARVRPSRQILQQRESIQVWLPHYDRMIDLFLETVDGEPPRVALDDSGKPVRDESGRYSLSGGWPCRVRPQGWVERATRVARTIRLDLERHRLCKRPRASKGSFAPLLAALERWIDGECALHDRELGRVRLILARTTASRGSVGSERRLALRRRQLAEVAPPTHDLFAQLLSARLARSPVDEGLDDVERVLAPVHTDETDGSGLEAGVGIPRALVRKVRRCTRDTIDGLVEAGIVSSGDTLANLLPQITADLQASAFVDPSLRRLHAAVYRAFRTRRSLLLLDLQHQVRIEELPWVAAMNRHRGDPLSAEAASREALEAVVRLQLTAFPQAVIPNKLVQEVQALAKTAGLDIPLVEEVAADIFMDRFSPKFFEAARRAARLVDGTLYGAYYGVDASRLEPRQAERSRWSLRRRASNVEPDLAAYCAERAGVQSESWSVARNGKVIEQQQIVTTQNLAVLVEVLGLRHKLARQFPEMARSCFTWIAKRLGTPQSHRHATLIATKQAAYAWRQMIFFLALAGKSEQEDFLGWGELQLEEWPPDLRARFAPAMEGLRLAIAGESPQSRWPDRPVARRFLGWTTGDHWLIDGAKQTPMD